MASTSSIRYWVLCLFPIVACSSDEQQPFVSDAQTHETAVDLGVDMKPTETDGTDSLTDSTLDVFTTDGALDSTVADLGADTITNDAQSDMGATDAQIANTHPRVYLNNVSERNRLLTLLSSGNSSANAFKQTVDSAVSGTKIDDYRAYFSALMYQLTGTNTYATDAIKRVDDFVKSEESKIAANQRASVAGDSYLEVGPVIGDLALVYDWCFDKLTDSQKQRWLTYANQAVSNVWNPNTAKWGATTYAWSGWSVDNPVNNYYYSFLTATMLLGLASKGENTQADQWLTKFRTTKIQNQLVPTFIKDLEGGGSREGTGYGVAMKELFKLYHFWHASTSENIADLTSHARLSMAHMIHSIVPTFDRLAPIGDHARVSAAPLFDYHRSYLLSLSKQYAKDTLGKVTRAFLKQTSVPAMTQQFTRIDDFLYADPSAEERPLTDLHTTYYGKGTGFLFSRSSWSKDAMWMNFIAGPYSESHAHRDQLSFMIYKDEWLAYDANFRSQSGIIQEELWHNLVRFEHNGSVIPQVEGRPPTTLIALQDHSYFTYARADATSMYKSPSPLSRVAREILFLKSGAFIVVDRIGVQSGTSGLNKIWQLHSPFTPTATNGTEIWQGTKAKLSSLRIAPPSVTRSVTVFPTSGADVLGGSRLNELDSTSSSSIYVHVLWVNNAVISTTTSESSNQYTVGLTLSGGHKATVNIYKLQDGGSLDYQVGTSTGWNGVLSSSVVAPPLLTQ